jgi:hypothetical protein
MPRKKTEDGRYIHLFMADLYLQSMLGLEDAFR